MTTRTDRRPRPGFTLFLQSDFNELSNQRDKRQTVTKRHQCLSDGPNVTDPRAAACEGQAWHAAEQRGLRADPQSRLGNWLDAPDTSPSAPPPLSHETLGGSISGGGGGGSSWPSFSPRSLSPSEFIDLPSYIYMFAPSSPSLNDLCCQ